MRVGLMNLGDGPRVFHNKINRAVVVPVGMVVAADLDTRAIQDLKFPSRPETVLVCGPDDCIPEDMQRVVNLLSVIEFEDPNKIMQQFHAVAPPNNMTGSMRPSRMQMRIILKTMVEDYVQAQVQAETGDKPLIKDDVDPSVLQNELDRQMGNDADSVHPLRQERMDRAKSEMTKPAHVPPATTRRPAPPARKAKTAKRGKE